MSIERIFTITIFALWCRFVAGNQALRASIQYGTWKLSALATAGAPECVQEMVERWLNLATRELDRRMWRARRMA